MKLIDTAASIGRSIVTPSDKHLMRMALCIKCPLKQIMRVPFFPDEITCGTPLYGNIIKHQGKKIELCGCVMAQKTKDPKAKCPIGKW